MMMYDFDTIVSRDGTHSLKWSITDGYEFEGYDRELPMWVADMEFPTAPAVIEALRDRLDNGVFGYSVVPDEWYRSYINWWHFRHGLTVKKEWLIFCTGVIPAISSAVRKLTTPNENVVIMSPVYNIFYNCIRNNGCRVLENRLLYKDGRYSADMEDLEKKLADPQTSLMLLCNPHNPVGKIWDRDTLAKIGSLASKYGVTVISDEIHCDLTAPGKDYIPFTSVSEECAKVSINCVAPTKAFNIAGIHTAAVFIPDTRLRHKVWRALNTDEIAEPNAFACTAAVAAFDRGEKWLDELRGYLFENRRVACEYIRKNIPKIAPVDAEATYLLWADISALGMDDKVFCELLYKRTGLIITEGSEYGLGGEGFVRINLACPRSMLLDGLERLKKGTAYISAE